MCWFFCIRLFPIISMKKFIHNFINIQKAKNCPRHLAADLDSTSPLGQRRNCSRTDLFRLASFWAYICFVKISFEFCTLHIFIMQCAKQTIGLSDLSFVWKRCHTSHKLGKHMSILVIQLNEPWKPVSEEVLGQDRIGGKRHLIKKWMTKRKYSTNIPTSLTFTK